MAKNSVEAQPQGVPIHRINCCFTTEGDCTNVDWFRGVEDHLDQEEQDTHHHSNAPTPKTPRKNKRLTVGDSRLLPATQHHQSRRQRRLRKWNYARGGDDCDVDGYTDTDDDDTNIELLQLELSVADLEYFNVTRQVRPKRLGPWETYDDEDDEDSTEKDLLGLEQSRLDFLKTTSQRTTDTNASQLEDSVDMSTSTPSLMLVETSSTEEDEEYDTGDDGVMKMNHHHNQRQKQQQNIELHCPNKIKNDIIGMEQFYKKLAPKQEAWGLIGVSLLCIVATVAVTSSGQIANAAPVVNMINQMVMRTFKDNKTSTFRSRILHQVKSQEEEEYEIIFDDEWYDVSLPVL